MTYDRFVLLLSRLCLCDHEQNSQTTVSTPLNQATAWSEVIEGALNSLLCPETCVALGDCISEPSGKAKNDVNGVKSGAKKRRSITLT